MWMSTGRCTPSRISSHLPGYETGLLDTSWTDAYRFPEGFGGELGHVFADGTGQTTPQGTLSIGLPRHPGAGVRAARHAGGDRAGRVGAAGQRADGDARPSRGFLHRLAPRSMVRPRRFAHRF